MSVVTNVLLHTACGEDVTLDQINTAIAAGQGGQAFRSLTVDQRGSLWGGYKNPEIGLCAAAFNYLLEPELFTALRGLPWSDRNDVQLLMQRQEDDILTVYSLDDLP